MSGKITVNGKVFNDQEEFCKYGRGCATAEPNHIQISRVDDEIRANSRIARISDKITITIQFFHITYGSKGNITKQQREDQMKMLNDSYNPYKIYFIHDESKVTLVNDYSWYYMGHRSVAEREAKSNLHIDPTTSLNFYTGGLQAGLLGWATFPFDLAGDPEMDGVVLLDESFPGGNAAPYNLGKTAVHEIGHWLGLYHTFQGGCDGFGDHVNDTVAHSAPNFGKPEEEERNKACKKGDISPIHNFMNYVDDDWMFKFTKLQMQRVKQQIAMYRPDFLRN